MSKPTHTQPCLTLDDLDVLKSTYPSETYKRVEVHFDNRLQKRKAEAGGSAQRKEKRGSKA